ncbi:Actin-related protein [Gracilaria domingensis]|nr:Actin-related protein [Gracilaria domingensis]
MGTRVVLDNGGSHIKAAKISVDDIKKISVNDILPKALRVPNALARPAKNAVQPAADKLGKSRRPPHFLVGREILIAPDTSGMSFRRPIDLGFVSAWDAQRDVWNSVFSSDQGIGLTKAEIASSSLIVTEQLGVPMHMRRAMDEFVFDCFGFSEYAPVPPQRLAALGVGRQTCLVLDTGFSFTTAVPIVEGKELAHCTKRLKVGGKLLTNYLREMITYRSWNMTDETAVVNAVKERLCYLSMSYTSELAATKKGRGITKEYVLPDLTRSMFDPVGHVLQQSEETDGTEQVLKMSNERIAIPEILFNPSDIGLNQAGVAETIFQAVEACPEHVRGDLYENIVLTGGNCMFSNFKERLELELRPMVDSIYEVETTMDEDPTLTAFHGGVRAAVSDSSSVQYVSKEMFAELGSDGILRELYGDEMEID